MASTGSIFPRTRRGLTASPSKIGRNDTLPGYKTVVTDRPDKELTLDTDISVITRECIYAVSPKSPTADDAASSPPNALSPKLFDNAGGVRPLTRAFFGASRALPCECWAISSVIGPSVYLIGPALHLAATA